MLSVLLLAAAAPGTTAVDAERAFAADARRLGQWTAFRKWADPTAVMFTPQAVWAHEFLKGRKDPPRAVSWWPARSFTSCDGDLAVNTGPSLTAEGRHGYFTTVWARQKDGGWKWTVDGGDRLVKPLARPSRPVVRKASCAGLRRNPAAPWPAPSLPKAAPPGPGHKRRPVGGCRRRTGRSPRRDYDRRSASALRGARTIRP